jgi:hypothetical protein
MPTSLPAEKARPPTPEMISTLMASSASTSRQTRTNSVPMAAVMALSLLGRFICICAMPPSTE